ncbi:MAG: hypothetical protein M0Q90_06865 [Bacteroidales bacterium]|nr:hypothetical protein [Bacteroidales bacterium]
MQSNSRTSHPAVLFGSQKDCRQVFEFYLGYYLAYGDHYQHDYPTSTRFTPL